MSDRLKKIFTEKLPKTKLVSYFVGCYPTPEISLELIKQAIDNGVSILEVGYVTSEASAEGPIIKAAHDYVLNKGHNLNDIIKLVKNIRDYNQDVGIVLMGYIANLYKYPISNFVDDIKVSGADAVLVVDAPHELKEENQLRDALNKNGLSLIKLAAPTTDDKRLKDIVNIASGFLYQVNVSGVTGVKSASETDVTNFVKRIRNLTNIPICTGFGIKSPEDAKKMSNSGCNGVIVGSAFVKYIQDNLNDKLLTQNVGKLIKSFTNVLE
ncbi:tryptophan synthase alpha chain [Candidatus Pelagibacter ubique]|uniref:Tryptophan synthase alpha chain n=1 Tax=Pelagibacter ubique TaxID=198252 RepID=A0ABX1T1Z9_PELUQ|nr:tryptophan synthase subunit alpha [Candidatus Pelagibacter ubique]NMN67479.1 tryptophan synthase alpha chain [Candidatus Pelagibacter ubique]